MTAYRRLPDPRSPFGERFDWQAAGLPHQDSPAGRYFDWHAVGLVHADAPAVNVQGWKTAVAHGNTRIQPVTFAKTEFRVPDTVEVVCGRWGVFGQGFFELHESNYECESGDRTRREPEIDVFFNSSKGQFEIRSITIYTLKIVNNPDPRALPRAGDNVTNEKRLGIRTPEGDPEGKGYWQDVIRDMERYERQDIGGIQWYAPGSTAYHEEVHNKQFREGIRNNRDAVIRKLEKAINLTFPDTGKPTDAQVRDAVRDAVRNIVRNVSSVTDGDSEPEAYRKTFSALWKPEIEKIRKYAREHNWK